MNREEQLTRSLDLAKIRVSQLMSELEAIKEANIIVLETKESVMRSLARQNSQLTVEVLSPNVHSHTESFQLIELTLTAR